MIRILSTVILLLAVSFAVIWFAEYHGTIVIEWLGYHIETSIAFALVIFFIMVAVLSLVMQLILFLKSAPMRYRKTRMEYKKQKGLSALTETFTAVAAGDVVQSKRLVKRAEACLGSLPVIRLLAAQIAQLEGNKELAKVHYTTLLESKETELVALKGLLYEARQEGDINRAIFLAERAFQLKPNTSWAITVLMDLYKRTKQWDKAEVMIEHAEKQKLMDGHLVKRQLAVISLAKSSIASVVGENEEALAFATDAYRLLGAFPPVAVRFAELQLVEGNKRKAIKALEQSWRFCPTPKVASIYLRIFSDETNERQLRIAEKLLQKAPHYMESHLLVAEIALNSGNFEKARNHLRTAQTIRETIKVCELMAEVEAQEDPENPLVHQWKKRALSAVPDATWVCQNCGHQTQEWEVQCSSCGNFDSEEWKNPSGKTQLLPDEPLLITM